jgi:lipoprotein-releasing system permease protein
VSFEPFVALRYLRSRGGQTFISLITIISMAGVALGVCALVVVLSVMSGFESELKNKILGMTAHVTLNSLNAAAIGSPGEILATVRADGEVLAATAYVQGQVMLVSAGRAQGAVLRGLETDPDAQVLNFDAMHKEGALAVLDQPRREGIANIMLGGRLAQRLGSPQIGQIITLINPIGEETPLGRAPKSEYFRFVGSVDSGMYQYDANMCFTPLPDAQEFFGLGERVSGVDVKIKDIYRAGQVGQRLTRALGFNLFYRDWMSSNYSLLAALRLEKVTMFIILTLIVLVAAFGIVSSLIMLVMQKTRDIGIMKAMGATDKSIRRIFLLMGGIIGALGALGGLGIGLFLCWLLAKYQFIELPEIYPLRTLPVEVEPSLVALVGILAVAACLAATVYPARSAGKLDPVEALRSQ